MQDGHGAKPGRRDVQPTDEARLIGEAQAGDRTAFEELVRRHDRGVLKMALRFVRSRDDARDIYQETFLRLYRTIGQFRNECSLETWILRIASSVCLDHLRRRAARPEESAPIRAGEPPGAGLVDSVDERPDHDPERALARQEIRRRIESALGGLAPRERLVFEMRHYEGMRLRQIGEVIGTTEETVKNCLFRAHQHLRGALRDLGDLGPPRIRPAGAARIEVRRRG
jgi:RNA polymerase sigma-70 factor (ECF subfamily)